MIGIDIREALFGTAVAPNSINKCELDYYEDVQEHNWLVLVFYPADFTWVCPTELQAIKDRYAEFKELQTDVWAISTDGVEVHQHWIQQQFGSLPYPLVADRNWDLSTQFMCLDENTGLAYRCTVMIDGKGIIRHYSVNDNNVGRNIDEMLRLLSAFQQADACGVVAQCGWTPGEEMITPGA